MIFKSYKVTLTEQHKIVIMFNNETVSKWVKNSRVGRKTPNKQNNEIVQDVRILSRSNNLQ